MSPMANPADWPLDEDTWVDFTDRVSEELEALALEELPDHLPEQYAREIALQRAGYALTSDLLECAMNVAVHAGLLGAGDGDGEGGTYHWKLDKLIEARLYPRGRPQVSAAARASEEQRRARSKVTATVRGRVLQRDGDRCKTCGSTDELQIDHIVPVARGGTGDIDNLQVLCRPCNASKGAKLP